MFWYCALALALSVLAACGGGTDATISTTSSLSNGIDRTTIAHQAKSSLAKGAQLNEETLADAEQQAKAAEVAAQKPRSGSGSSRSATSADLLDQLDPGQIAPKGAYASGAVARKALAVRIPAYRFYNGRTGAHFFTTSTTERDNIVAHLSPPFSLEGEAFSVASAFSPGLSPVHRFYNTRTGVHFYTISEAERANVVATLPSFSYEGVAYHASQVAGAGFIPFYRFFVPSKGFHFYTASESEKNSVIANLSATYTYEGVGYYVLASDWQPWLSQLPHTGVTDQQCMEAGNTAYAACNTPQALALSHQQDGHRTSIHPMSYSVISNPAGGNFAITECVKDDITTLIWEGKQTDSSLRGYAQVFTNYDNPSQLQKYDPATNTLLNPTQLEIDAPNNTVGYVKYVNAMGLCGFNDWRLPDANELQGIVNYGNQVPNLWDSSWFANAQINAYWSSSHQSANNGSGLNASAWQIDFAYGRVTTGYRSQSKPVRLVRGPRWQGNRYSVSSTTYAGDAAENLVIDAKTALQWRRCVEGQLWTGSACSGTPTAMTLEQAFTHAGSLGNGWRLANTKELESLVNLDNEAYHLVNPLLFPNAPFAGHWSSTPVQNGTILNGLATDFIRGSSYLTTPNTANIVRLVRSTP